MMLHHLRSLLHLPGDNRGSALVEFTLVLPLLLLLFGGFAEFGRALYHHHIIETSLRAAGRYLSKMPVVDQDASAPCTSASGSFAEQGRMVAITGTPDGSGTPLLPYWTTADLNSVCISPITRTLTDASGATFDVTVIRLRASVRFVDSGMLGLLGFTQRLTLEAYHEERHIGS